MSPSCAFSRLCVLSLATILTSCGGGDSSEEPATTVALQITLPRTTGNVFTAGTPVAVRASAKVHGALVADGTVVRFSAPTGRFVPAHSASQGGQASSTLTSSSTGALQITASVQEARQSGATTETIYQRLAPAPLEILVPAYFYPSVGSDWNPLAASAAAHPTVGITAIMNPNNGILSSADANFTRAVSQFVGAGGTVLGYVYTRYGKGNRSMADIKTNIDRYLQFYGRERIAGIFLDEMASDTTKLDFYREIYRYIKAIDPNLRVVGNPGMVPDPAFASVADTLVSFEGTASAYQKYDPRVQSPWLYIHANQTQAALVHNADNCPAMQDVVQAAASARNNAGWVYATDRAFNYTTGAGNPWATLPTYWETLVQTVGAINAGASLPRC